MKLEKPDAVIWDWDNTLVDTWPIIHAALVKTFDAFGMQPWPIDKVKTNVKKSMRDSFPLVFGENWQRAADIYQQAYRATALENLTPLEGSVETLELFKKHGIPQFVVSNKKGDNLRDELNHLQWNDYFLGVVGSGDTVKDKPHADHAWHALKPHSIQDVSNIWFIGDSDADLECAKNLGCKAVLYGTHVLTLPEYTLTHLNDFPFIHHAHDHASLHKLLDF